MFNFSKQFNTTTACSAAASSYANLSVIMDAALLASILFTLLVLDLGVLLALVSILRIIACKQPSKRLA